MRLPLAALLLGGPILLAGCAEKAPPQSAQAAAVQALPPGRLTRPASLEQRRRMVVDIYASHPTDALSAEEMALYRLLMAHRAAHGLPPVPLSRALSITAARHAVDTVENLGGFHVGEPGESRAHAWSYMPYDGRNPATWPGMWEAPGRLGTGYLPAAYEISTGITGPGNPPMTPAIAMQSWRASPAHEDVILNRGQWSPARLHWRAVGIGLYRGVAHVWWGAEPDPSGQDASRPTMAGL
ncbi:CAP domain-containing protein [Falsiroseomonas selenitidurans]|uniref:SCP domain-containing protein n=1 Tax=Falsiroseomonas selenitidurans TaxID=2716335 RepID=A0ABX1E0H2_9PROT|nr:hypothetical protein [Falsiroseomonas selenitidurans]NKC30654.1 hypothetical protein [Falsiroseomonas selenitidurans]